MNTSHASPAERPSVVVILADDMGYSDIGCYGGEISTPNLDRLAAGELRMSQFYNTARCSPSRASLLTGLHPHQTGIGILTDDQRPWGYNGSLNDRCVTAAEVLGRAGYARHMSGKWHLTGQTDAPGDAWPTRRGFQHFYGTLLGGPYFHPSGLTRQEENIEDEALDPGFYYTDAIGDATAGFIAEHVDRNPEQPFFAYVAFTAPHWPLQAPEDDVAAYAGRYDAGWDAIRHNRQRRLVDLGLLDPSWAPTDRDPSVPAWDDVGDHEWQTRRMQVYAAQVTRMDRGIGTIVAALESAGVLEDTLVVFLSDNGGSAEEMRDGWADELPHVPAHIRRTTRGGRRVRLGNTPEVVPGPENTFASYGRAWANVSNTPFREYKHWVHEGGIATPLIAHWPAAGLDTGTICHQPGQLPDVMATVLAATGVDFPDDFPNRDPLPIEGMSLLPAWRGERTVERELFFEHEGNAAVRRGRWKLVRKFDRDWELFDIVADRGELRDLSESHPAVVADLAASYQAWAARCGVIPRERILDAQHRRHGP